MSRHHIVPLAFFTTAVVTVGLLGARVRAFEPPPVIPNLVGTWDGFFHDVDVTGQLGLAHTVIDRQSNRQFFGRTILTDVQTQAVFNAHNFTAVITAADFVVGTGVGPTGRVVFQGDLATFDSGPGAAGLIEPALMLVPVRGNPGRVASILLRPFAAVNPPSLVGSGDGVFQSRVNPAIGGTFDLSFLPNDGPGTSFPGTLQSAMPGLPGAFRLLASSSDNNQFVMIGQGAGGQFVVAGVVRPPIAGGPTTIDANYRLNLFNRPVDFGAMNFEVGATIE